jgi:hypothetical protein
LRSGSREELGGVAGVQRMRGGKGGRGTNFWVSIMSYMESYFQGQGAQTEYLSGNLVHVASVGGDLFGEEFGA